MTTTGARGDTNSKPKSKKKGGGKKKGGACQARTIVKRLAELSKDADNRDFMVKDGGCLAGLVKYLKNSDVYVHTLAIQTLKLLGESFVSLSGEEREKGRERERNEEER